MFGFGKKSAPAPAPSGDSEQAAAPGEAGRQTPPRLSKEISHKPL
ncbi:hypothetical protein [Pseudomonas aeruginosa]|nr:hypothetical protein [Pseudomonas aeruginosa]